MKIKKISLTGGVLLGLVFLAQMTVPQPVKAMRGVGPARHGRVLAKLPTGYQAIRFGNVSYFLHQGIFYRQGPSGFVVVNAPVGVVVTTLPVGFTPLVIGGVNFYLAKGVYYRQAPGGYLVVENPVSTVTAVNAGTSIEPAAVERVMVTVTRLNVRSGPGKTHPILFQVQQGDGLRVEGQAPGWFYVRISEGRYGWVMSSYTRSSEEQAQG